MVLNLLGTVREMVAEVAISTICKPGNYGRKINNLIDFAINNRDHDDIDIALKYISQHLKFYIEFFKRSDSLVNIFELRGYDAGSVLCFVLRNGESTLYSGAEITVVTNRRPPRQAVVCKYGVHVEDVLVVTYWARKDAECSD